MCQGITPDGESKRQVLGEEIVKEIRFPLMLEKEFASVVIDSRILSLDEVGDLVKHYYGVLTSLPFAQTPRKRFGSFNQPNMITLWLYLGLHDVITTAFPGSLIFREVDVITTGLNNVCACARYHGSRWRQRPGHHNNLEKLEI